MKLVRNAGTDRVLDLIAPELVDGNKIDLLTASGSLFAFEALPQGAGKIGGIRLVMPSDATKWCPLGNADDRPARNRLQVPSLARNFAEWLRSKADVRFAPGVVPQGLAVLRGSDGSPRKAVHGSFSFSTEGLGVTAGNPLNFIQSAESAQEAELLAHWFDQQWESLGHQPEAKSAVLAALDELAAARELRSSISRKMK